VLAVKEGGNEMSGIYGKYGDNKPSLEDFVRDAKHIKGLVYTIWEAMQNEHTDAREDYAGAMYILLDEMEALSDNLSALYEETWEKKTGRSAKQ